MSAKQHITLFQLQGIIRDRLEEAMPLPCWVTAEISELKVNYSGHCYLELVEKGGANQVPKAKATAVIWRSSFGMLSSYFKSETGTELSEGMNVLVKVSVGYHELYGLSLNITDIDPLYTLGDMERQRQQTIQRLQDEGVFDMNRSLELPSVTQRIAVVSSRNAAGYQDFMNELSASGYYFDITLFDAFMQGHAAEDSVVDALERIAENPEIFDAAVVIRGGGSQSDLAAFDSYRLCAHIAQFPLPVITGIGHDKDQSVADLVAYEALKTPTAVAGYLIEGLAQFDQWLDNLKDDIFQQSVSILENERRRVRSAGYTLSQAASTLTHGIDMRLERLAGELNLKIRDAIASRQAKLNLLGSLFSTKIPARLSEEKNRLESFGRLIKSRDPDNILSLGFAIVRKDGRVLKNTSGLARGEQLDISLSQGRLTAKVENIEKQK